ncbi:hypothetical protein ILUMI_01695 [Ignelater luminosus]|uniref:Malate dehydrogenase, mitochondrial n=1 Tax=Ignelater luminosus TaxID=2038154 RepID=A0A8K0DEU8_IGNLU|nr:hypothetical protein ILUMI_01695 [Ignelater luminosus]
MNFLKLPVLLPRATKFILKRYASCFQPIVCESTTRPIVVTITGANTGSAKIVALLLKQSPLIDELRLFDYDNGPCGTALDLSHIDTSTKVKPYSGLSMLKEAVEGSKIVVVCGGEATKAAHPEYELFRYNADYVRNIAIYTSEFSPESVLCIATPPITAMVPLASEEYKKAQVYDSRKIIGVTTLSMIRANTFIAAHGGQHPERIMCPTIGGMGYKTTVAVVSQTDIGAKLASPVADVLRNRIANAENHVLQVQYIENAGACCITNGFATARFITSVVKGLLDIFDGFECGFVRQTGEAADFLSYMGSVIKLGCFF